MTFKYSAKLIDKDYLQENVKDIYTNENEHCIHFFYICDYLLHCNQIQDSWLVWITCPSTRFTS